MAQVLKYIFIIIIYLFIIAIIRMIYLDIRTMNYNRKKRSAPQDCAYLEVLTDLDTLYFEAERYYPLTSEQIIIGRGADCSIRIDDLYMSSQHTRLWFEDGEWYIEDLNSTNGTYVNGKRMKNAMILDNGDKIRIGQIEFLVVLS